MRLTAIDTARGIAMLMMLINHAAWRIPEVNFGANYGWNTGPVLAETNPAGWINLLQGTPLFMLLTGFGIALFEHARRRRGWTEAQITRYFVIRCTILILIDFLVIPWLITPAGIRWESKFFVLSCIGLCLWVMAYLRHIPARQLLLFAGFLTLSCQVIYHLAAPTDSDFLRALLFYPSPTDTIAVGFPVFAWLPVIILGYCSGRYAINQPEDLPRHAVQMGITGLVLWAGITIGDGFGVLYHDHPLIMTKHPPDLAYLAFNIGWAYLILAASDRIRLKPLAAMGQSALIFYVVHWYVLAIVTGLLSLVAAEWLLYVVVCGLALAVLYPVCVRYKQIRTDHPAILQYL